MNNKKPSLLRSLGIALLVLLALVIYAYGFEVTDVSFEEMRSEQRQTSLTRILRAMAQPDIIEYEQQEVVIDTPIRVPCAGDPASQPAPGGDGAYIVITPACAEPEAEVQVEGFNFPPNATGPVAFIPLSGVTLRRGTLTTDGTGHFITTIELPDRPAPDQDQTIRVTTRQNVGSPRFTRTAEETWYRIIETVFLALLATTFGVLFSIPISFFAARNLMRDVTTTVSSLALSIIAWPIGMWLGGTLASRLNQFSEEVLTNPVMDALVLVAGGVVLFAILRFALPAEELEPPSPGTRRARTLALYVALVIGLLVFILLAQLLTEIGRQVAPDLGGFGFLANFLASLGEIVRLLILLAAAVVGGAILSNYAGRIGKVLYRNLAGGARLGVNILLAAIAGAMLFALVGAGLNWLYQFNDPMVYLVWPAVAGALFGIALAIWFRRLDIVPIGLVVYNITRTILNFLRAIEALIMAIIFVVWVGIGPFAGVLALTLHTVAALAKLYSEQVESIMAGPLEAIKATGANRLQTIIYAVVPQIVPPYISFTMYRWDINVRMSTIIGFVGGGGIGFLLQQNINLANYRAASAQMLAIAVVVSLMDYLSSYMREKVV